MNPDFWAKLPPDLQEARDEVDGRRRKGGRRGLGRARCRRQEGDDRWRRRSRSSSRPEEDAKFRKIGAEVAEAKIKELEGKGMPATRDLSPR